MHGFFIRWLILTASIMLTSYLLDGIYVKGSFSAFFAAAALGVLNSIFRPILILLTLPITVLTLGLFLFAVNAIMLMMVSGLISGFEVRGFGSAIIGSLLISLISWFLTSFIGERGSIQYIDLKRVGKDRWE
jgi:putative membrane protein